MIDDDSAATRALRAGRLHLADSFRLHRPRGAFCHAGWCQQCRVTTADGGIALACRTDASARPPRRGWRSLLGRWHQGLPPWFYEERLLWPRSLRQFYLERLRRLSAAPGLPMGPAPIEGRWQEGRCEVLVVGGGLAGLAAAATAKASGRDVLLVEAEPALGGRARFRASERARLAQTLREIEGVRSRTGTLCASLYDEARRALLIGLEGPTLLDFEELVVATGAYDRLPSFSGSDLPGIIGLRAFERLAAARAIPESWRIGLFAGPEEGAAALSTWSTFAWVAGPRALPATRSKIHPDVRLLAAEGRRRIAAVRLADGTRLACDLLVLGFSQPGYELQMQAGQRALLAGEPPVVLTEGEAKVPLRVVGEAAHRPTATPAAVVPSPDAILCLCEDVRRRDALAAIGDGFDDVELLKRRTGAGTGPCQGKLCHAEMLACLAEAGRPVALPTQRPLLRPVALADLAAADAGA